eukprot:CAMPEP_0174830544 /NCGR_PEP_ID=MMETSP1114-20130205/2581_1 /TAXON_ID=312471 /ORGANISM="Neobodo designis, Strain CCAP 1951/1" /LENGTH=78 /DNA_ID=CAMNT_0016064343 /DNA_START=41 /DNA_END=277 /DNA_ORIENTATION=-
MGKKHREKRQKYVDYLRQREKEEDAKKAAKEEKKRLRDKESEDKVKEAVSKPTAQSAVAAPKRTDEGETSIKKVRTER